MHSAVKAEFSLRTLCEDRGLLHRGLCVRTECFLHRGLCVRTEDFLHRVAQRTLCEDRGLCVRTEGFLWGQRAFCAEGFVRGQRTFCIL